MGFGGEEVVLFNYYRVITCNSSKHNDRNPDNSQGGDQGLGGRRAEQPGRCHSLILSLFVILETFFEEATQVFNLGKALIESYLLMAFKKNCQPKKVCDKL